MRQTLSLLLIFFIFAAMIWLQGFISFTQRIPKQQTELRLIPKTETILVFTGEGERLSTAMDILSAKKADHLFISGVHRNIDLPKLLKAYRKTSLACCIELDYEAQNTKENTYQSRKWMEKKGYHSAILVTSGYHMPRSILYMQEIFPEADFTPYPVLIDKSNLIENFLLIANEYHKYVWAKITIFLSKKIPL